MATKKSTTKAKTKSAKTAKKSTAKAKTAVKKKTVSKAKTSAKTTKKSVKKQTLKVNPLQSLKKLLVFGALLCVVLAGLVVAYGNDIVTGFTASYLAENTLTQDGSLLSASRELFTINLTYVIAGVLFAAAVWRTLLATRLFANYSNQVNKKLTSFNWVELSVFGPWIVAIIAVSAGVRDVMTLLLVAGSVSFVGVLGYLTDRYNLVGKDTWFKKVIITKALLLPWVVVAVSAWFTNLYGFVTFDVQVYGLLIGGFLLYMLLAFVHRGQTLATGKFKDFVATEKLIGWLHIALLALLAIVAFL